MVSQRMVKLDKMEIDYMTFEPKLNFMTQSVRANPAIT